MDVSVLTFPSHIAKRVFSIRHATETGCQPGGMERFHGQKRINWITLYDEDFNLPSS